MARAIAYMTYISFARKYNTATKNAKGEPKSMRQLAQEIHRYEMKNINKLKTGLYIQ